MNKKKVLRPDWWGPTFKKSGRGHNKAIKRAFTGAYVNYLYGKTQSFLLDKSNGLSLDPIEYLRDAFEMDPSHAQRKFVHYNMDYPPHFFLSLSTLLNLDTSEILPNRIRWVADAVQLLMLNNGATPSERLSVLFAAACTSQTGNPDLGFDQDQISDAIELLEREANHLLKAGPPTREEIKKLLNLKAMIAQIIEEEKSDGK